MSAASMASLLGKLVKWVFSTRRQEEQPQEHGQSVPSHAGGAHQPRPGHLKPQPQPHASRPHAAVEHTAHRPYRNENLINQNNEHYKQLRARAKEAGDAMARCFDESHQAYAAGDGARAKQLSQEGHAHQKEMNDLNSQASDWIFHANNTDSGPGEIDLHGLYVKEAITHTERAIRDAQARRDSEIRLIVGKGLHTTDHVAKIRPAIEDLMRKYNLAAHLDEHNSGVLVVTLDGRVKDGALGLDDITRRLERNDERCVVM